MLKTPRRYRRSRAAVGTAAFCGGVLLAAGHLFADPATILLLSKTYGDVEDLSSLPVLCVRSCFNYLAAHTDCQASASDGQLPYA
jgi:hypothetical protein